MLFERLTLRYYATDKTYIKYQLGQEWVEQQLAPQPGLFTALFTVPFKFVLRQGQQWINPTELYTHPAFRIDNNFYIREADQYLMLDSRIERISPRESGCPQMTLVVQMDRLMDNPYSIHQFTWYWITNKLSSNLILFCQDKFYKWRGLNPTRYFVKGRHNPDQLLNQQQDQLYKVGFIKSKQNLWLKQKVDLLLLGNNCDLQLQQQGQLCDFEDLDGLTQWLRRHERY